MGCLMFDKPDGIFARVRIPAIESTHSWGALPNTVPTMLDCEADCPAQGIAQVGTYDLFPIMSVIMIFLRGQQRQLETGSSCEVLVLEWKHFV
jgi:hypothetical protein